MDWNYYYGIRGLSECSRPGFLGPELKVSLSSRGSPLTPNQTLAYYKSADVNKNNIKISF